MNLPVLSLWEPWATLIMLGLKQWETRDWELKLRGPLVIHAAKKRFVQTQWPLRFLEQMAHDGVRYMSLDTYGCALGIVDVTDEKPTSEMRPYLSLRELLYGNYDDGRRCFRCESPRRFPKPIPLVGRQGVFNWEVSDELVAECY